MARLSESKYVVEYRATYRNDLSHTTPMTYDMALPIVRSYRENNVLASLSRCWSRDGETALICGECNQEVA